MSNLKDSGINWIGTMPNDWKVKKIKYIGELNGRIGWQGLTSNEYIDEGPFLITGTDFKDGRIDWDTCVHIDHSRWEEAKKIQIKNGDLLITKDGTVGKVAIVENLEGLASLNSGVLKIDLKEGYLAKFLFYVLQSDVFWTWFNYTSSGNSTILHLYEKDFNNFTFSIPDKDEQEVIINFLDSNVGSINLKISKIEKQIKILKEYIKSLVSETITKGLEKNVEYKDTSIDWIGKIPANWSIKRLKHLFYIYAGGDIDYSDYDEAENEIQKYPILSNSLEHDGVIGYTSKFRFEGDTITVTGRGLVGVAVPRNFKFYPVVRLLVGEPKDRDDVRYFSYCINSANVIGDQTAMAQLTREKLGDIKVPYPLKKIQIEIANFLDTEVSKINHVIETKEQQITKLIDYKNSLVYEYVTGKKRVGGFGNGD